MKRRIRTSDRRDQCLLMDARLAFFGFEALHRQLGLGGAADEQLRIVGARVEEDGILFSLAPKHAPSFLVDELGLE